MCYCRPTSQISFLTGFRDYKVCKKKPSKLRHKPGLCHGYIFRVCVICRMQIQHRYFPHTTEWQRLTDPTVICSEIRLWGKWRCPGTRLSTSKTSKVLTPVSSSLTVTESNPEGGEGGWGSARAERASQVHFNLRLTKGDENQLKLACGRLYFGAEVTSKSSRRASLKCSRALTLRVCEVSDANVMWCVMRGGLGICCKSLCTPSSTDMQRKFTVCA